MPIRRTCENDLETNVLDNYYHIYRVTQATILREGNGEPTSDITREEIVLGECDSVKKYIESIAETDFGDLGWKWDSGGGYESAPKKGKIKYISFEPFNNAEHIDVVLFSKEY